MPNDIEFPRTEGFQWDDGNSDKSWRKHKVSDAEAEELFFNEPLLIFIDTAHSQKEARYYCLGQTDRARTLFVVFTIRGQKIRIISVRDMNKKERNTYEKEIKKHSTVSR